MIKTPYYDPQTKHIRDVNFFVRKVRHSLRISLPLKKTCSDDTPMVLRNHQVLLTTFEACANSSAQIQQNIL